MNHAHDIKNGRCVNPFADYFGLAEITPAGRMIIAVIIAIIVLKI